ncbi:MAG: hypothetical protein AAFU49_09650 [Pseudomonadota bacterium]
MDLSEVVLTHYKLGSKGKASLSPGETDDTKLQPMTETGSGQVRDKQKALLDEIIQHLNDLFGGDSTDADKVAWIEHTRSKIMENETLRGQAANNSKEQFRHSPDFEGALMDAIIEGLDAYSGLSKQALEDEAIRRRLKDILLGPGQLWEMLRKREGGHRPAP